MCIHFNYFLWTVALYFVFRTWESIIYLSGLSDVLFRSIDCYFYNITDSIALIFACRTIRKFFLRNDSERNNWQRQCSNNHRTFTRYKWASLFFGVLILKGSYFPEPCLRFGQAICYTICISIYSVDKS